jgi:plastocyanin
MTSIRFRVTPVIAALFGFAAVAAGQGTVSGQVALTERPGEKTEDIGSTVIYLEPVGGAKPKTSSMSVTMDMKNRAFSPHVHVVTEGSKVAFPNKDPWKHNVFSKAPQGPFDTDLYAAGKTKDNVFKQAGIYPIYCNIHPRMIAYVIALATPYFTQAGADGRFSIAKVPAGKYVLHVWHERAPEQTTEVTVAATGLTAQRYQLDARNYKYVGHKDKTGKDYVYTGDIY